MAAPRVVRLSPDDNLVVADDQIPQGTNAAGVTAGERISRGHKMAVLPIDKDPPVKKFGQFIGFASKPILPGTQNQRTSATAISNWCPGRSAR